MFVLIFLISNLIFSENKKLNENYGIEDGEVYYINRKIEGADAKTFEIFEDKIENTEKTSKNQTLMLMQLLWVRRSKEGKNILL